MSDLGNIEQGDEEANISSCQTPAPNRHSESEDVPNSFPELPKVEGVSVIPDAKYSSHTLKVEWKPIDEQDVKYTVVCSTNAGDVSKPPEESLEMNTDNNETSTVLTNLEEGTRYYIWVKAISTRGREGPCSDRTIGATFPKLEHPTFMPFAFDFNGGPTTNSWGGERRCLEQLLLLDFCNDCAMKNGRNRGKAICEDPEHWLRQAVQLLWDEGEDQTDVTIQEVALCLMNAVRMEYKEEFEKLPRGERGLFWVLDATLPPMPKKEKAKQATLNIFSFRALLWAVLRDSTEEELKKADDQGLFPIHYAAEKIRPDAVLYLHSRAPKLFDVNQQSTISMRTALHFAVRFWHPELSEQKCQKKLVQVLEALKADHSVPDAVGHVPLFNAILTEDINLVKLLIDPAPINHGDKDKDTQLHVATALSLDEIACLLIENGADPELRNDKRQTPFHFAAQKSDTCLKAMCEARRREKLEIVDIFSQEDDSRHTPLDYAAIHSHQKTFHYMWERIQGHPKPGIASYKPVLDRLFDRDAKKIRLAILQQTLERFSKPGFQSFLTTDTDPGQGTETEEQSAAATISGSGYRHASLYNLLQSEDDACIPVVNTVLDKCLYGDKVVVSKVLDSGQDGEYPPKSNHDAVLRKFVSSHYAFWGHRTMKIWINGKWNQFGNFIVCLIAFLYFLQMLALTTALSLAIRPGVTDEMLTNYDTPLDQFRAFVEAVVILMWIVKIGNELFKLIVLQPKIYFRDLFVYVNISAIVLLLITIILRFAQSNIQWVFAALAYLMYAMLALEYLSLLNWSSTYIQTLFSIMKVDMTKFFAVFLVYLVGFAGAFLLVLQVDRANPAAVQEAGGVSSASGGDGADNSTVYIWNTFYIGLRLMMEAGSVLKYNGSLGWLAVVLYLSFLLVTAIIMLNVLIAQMSDTYTKVRQNARALATFHRARFLLRYLKFYEHWHSRDGNNATETKNLKWIIWSGKDMGPNKGGYCSGAWRYFKDFAKHLFLGDQIALREERSTDVMQETTKQLKAELKQTNTDVMQETTKQMMAELKQRNTDVMQETTKQMMAELKQRNTDVMQETMQQMMAELKQTNTDVMQEATKQMMAELKQTNTDVMQETMKQMKAELKQTNTDVMQETMQQMMAELKQMKNDLRKLKQDRDT